MSKDFHIAEEVFKAYDIRGIVPQQIDAAAAEQIARAFADEVKPETAIVGRDVRLSGEDFMESVLHGLTSMGVNVINIGVVCTDEFYFACGKKKLPGIMITASHNPPEYNGFKMVVEMPYFVMAKEFKPKVIEGEYPDVPQKGRIMEEPVTEAFLDFITSLIKPSDIKPMKVAVDTSNGATGPVWEKLAPRLPIELIPLCFEPDGNFPNHGNDIIQLDNQQMLRNKVKETGADLGLIFDPDGDRCLLVDDRGVSVPGDWITALLGVAELKKNPGATILYDVRASDAVPDLVSANGGTPFVWKPGHVYIKREMQKRGIVFGGEGSGHYYFKDFWYADSGFLTAMTILSYVSSLEGPLSEKIKTLEAKYFVSGEINSKVEDAQSILDKVKEVYRDGEINEISGVAMRYPDWHFVVRPSDNEPLVRLSVEANTKELMEEKRDELLKLIRG